MFRHLSAAAIGLCLLALPAAAKAQETPVAEARAHADAIIAEAEAGAWFTNVTDSDAPRVRHEPSGMVCSFPAIDPRNAINLYPVVTGGPPAGDDVGCAAWWGSTLVSIFATRFPQSYDQEFLMGAAIHDVEKAWEDVQPYDGDFRVTTFGDQPTPLVYAFSATRDGRSTAQAIVVRNIGDWSFKARATSFDEDEEVALAATAVFGMSIPGGWEEFLAAQAD